MWGPHGDQEGPGGDHGGDHVVPIIVGTRWGPGGAQVGTSGEGPGGDHVEPGWNHVWTR